MISKQVTWTQSGHQIAVEVTAQQFVLTLDGIQSRHASIVKPAPRDRAMYAQRNAYGNLGKLVIYNDRAEELLAIQEEIKAADPMTEFRRLEVALYAAQEVVRTWQDRGDNPAVVYANEQQAQAALNVWCEAHHELYEAEVARRKEAKQARIDSIRVDMWM